MRLPAETTVPGTRAPGPPDPVGRPGSPSAGRPGLAAAVLAGFAAVACAPDLPLPDDPPEDDDGTAGDDDSAPGPDPSDALYDPARLIQVEITLDPADWDSLRLQSRDIVEMLTGDCLAGPFESPYTWFEAALSFDGARFDPVAVSKKGLLGSESSTKPALKLDLDRYVPDQEIHGRDRLTLNNSVQDPSYLHQCLAYAVFASAGVPAPRCSFARVSVNGDDLGVYVHVEPIRKDLLGRHFADDGGNLYEGTLSDFRDGWVDTFQKDTNEEDPDRSDLEAVVDALDAGDDAVVEALGEVVDLEAFLTYWAAEVLVGQWDGYAANVNNFYVYHDPTSDRFHFLPWGVDAALGAEEPFGEGAPVSVVGTGVLANRLLSIPVTRDRYAARLAELLDAAWDEDVLLGEIDRMEALVRPVADPDGQAGMAAHVETVRDVVRGRRAAIEAELADGLPEWEGELPADPCLDEVGTLSATFTTGWGSYPDGDVFEVGSGDVEVVWDGQVLPVAAVGASAGWADDDTGSLLVVAYLSFDAYLAVLLSVPAASIGPGSEPLDWNRHGASLYFFDPATMSDFGLAGFLGEGTLTFEEAGTGAGEEVSGVIEGVILG